MNDLEVLKKARELITDKARWRKRGFFGIWFNDIEDWYDPSTMSVETLSQPNNLCFCVMGAVCAVSNEKTSGNLADVLDTSTIEHFAKVLGFRNATNAYVFNDNATHEQVLTKIDAAIAKLEATDDRS